MSAKQQEVEPQWSAEQIAQATDEITQLTPEMYLEMVEHIRTLEDQAINNLPVAGGESSARLYNASGGYVYIKCSAFNGLASSMDLARTVAWFKAHVQGEWTLDIPTAATTATAPTTHAAPPAPTAPVAPTASTPSTAPTAPTGTVVHGQVMDSITVPVQFVCHQLTSTGKHMVKVKSTDPRFSRFGLTAWPEVLPEGVQVVFEQQWPVGQDLQPPEGMGFAEAITDGVTSSGNPRWKIIDFHD